MNETMAAVMADSNAITASMQNAMPIQILQLEDVADAVAWLVSDQAKYITGVALPVDAGSSFANHHHGTPFDPSRRRVRRGFDRWGEINSCWRPC